jgi:DNA polymerase-3 subunit alpha
VSFVHLHRHSEWSIGDGTGSGELYAEQAGLLGQPALAITDHGSLAGTLYHMHACEKVGIKPILGMEAYFRKDVSSDRENKLVRGYFHLVLLAKTEEGWKNLMWLSSEANRESHFYQKPCVDIGLLKGKTSGLIATSSCLNGYIPKMSLNGDFKEAEDHIRLMRSLFGDDFFFEIQPHDIPEQQAVNEYVVGMAKEEGIPFVATSDVHSPYKDWTETQAVRVMAAYNQTMKGKKKSDEDDEEAQYGGLPYTYLMDAEELRAAFKAHHGTLTEAEVDTAIKQSLVIAESCDTITVSKAPKIPRATKSLLEAERVLRNWCKEGLERIGKTEDQFYLDRVDEELAMMRKLRNLDYFVIVADMVRWAKDNGIRIGPGRGSAGGSLVCYLTRITSMDPIGYNLLFERFLNEYRTEMPDVDFDIDPTRRQELKAYLVKRWGADKVIDVSAFQSFGLKAVVQDVARVLGVSYPETKKATDLIPKLTFGETLETMEEQLPGLKAYFNKHPEVAKHAKRLQGQIKGASKHAAAVIVTDVPAEEVIPLMRSKDGSIVTQWSERANAQLLSPYGFLKIDMLVTDALTVQAEAIRLIKERHGLDIDFEDPKQFPVIESPLLSDPKVIEAFAHGRNLGVFQFASSGISGLLKGIKPETLEHVIAANALYRPGTLSNGMAREYAARKNGLMWHLPHEAAREFLQNTFGIITFQEQVMQMYKALGKDIDSSESAVFLKVVAKGIARDVEGKAKLQKYYSKFEAGCLEKGIAKKEVKDMWDNILEMTTYSFNRSHSAGYALQGYQDQWLKTNYPLEFYTPLLTIEPKKIPQIIRESRQFGIKVLPPDINQSEAGFAIDGNAIRFGLLAVGNVGEAALSSIKVMRPFESWAEFYKSVEARKCNVTAKRNLHNCGAFDTLGERQDWPLIAKAEQEKAVIGTVLSGESDIAKYGDLLNQYITPSIEFEEFAANEEMIQVGGEVIAISDKTTKKGDEYARVTVALGDDETVVNFWKDTYSKYRHMLADGAVVLISGHYDVQYESVSARYCVTAEQLVEEVKKEEK